MQHTHKKYSNKKSFVNYAWQDLVRAWQYGKTSYHNIFNVSHYGYI